MEGGSLDRLIPQGGTSNDDLLAIATGLAEALAAAHEKKIIHRDLKPANVMWTKVHRVKVLDFGLAKMNERGNPSGSEISTAMETRKGVVMGTVPCMSSEQVQGRVLDHRTDIFSLGVLLYGMATGRRPFQADSEAGLVSAILRDMPEPVPSLRPDLPGPLVDVIATCLQKDPAGSRRVPGRARSVDGSAAPR
ncbi:MAG TPA: serine/threonine-protein kinase [Candidatus Saccharimonadales bacterium]|nr:serine/threonine-protein kinase [Candidatus Saccharimonadales bacterium]